jgi:hypothetical protein
MRNDGLGAWPAQSTLAIETGLTEKTVREALKRLVAARWLHRVTQKQPGRGARGMGFEYRATLPPELATLFVNPVLATVFTGKRAGRRRRSIPAVIDGKEIRSQLPTNATEGTLQNRAYREKDEEREIEEMRRAFGEIA